VSALLRFVTLYALMYAAFGVSSPFMPAFFHGRGLTPDQLGILFGVGTAIRLVSGPLCGRLADRTQALRAVLASCAALAALVALGLLSAGGFSALLTVSVVHAAALAPITTLADALALSAAAPRHGGTRFEYGWVRGTGSAVFITGTLISGQVVGMWGLSSIVGLHSALLIGAAGAAMLVPRPARQEAGRQTAADSQRLEGQPGGGRGHAQQASQTALSEAAISADRHRHLWGAMPTLAWACANDVNPACPRKRGHGTRRR